MPATDYRITATPKPAGAHWDSMLPPAADLARQIEDMAAMLRLYRGEATPEDRERLDVPSDPVEFCDDLARDLASVYALEVNVAHWDDSEDLACAVFLLGFGGPNIWLTITYNHAGSPERVTLERYWSESDSATTDDHRALEVVAEFVEAFFVAA